MKSFWAGFEKRANPDGSADGGGGFFAGQGKGNLIHTSDRDDFNGTQQGYGRADGEDSRTDKTQTDMVRNPRSFDPFSNGPELQDESNPHIRY